LAFSPTEICSLPLPFFQYFLPPRRRFPFQGVPMLARVRNFPDLASFPEQEIPLSSLLKLLQSGRILSFLYTSIPGVGTVTLPPPPDPFPPLPEGEKVSPLTSDKSFSRHWLNSFSPTKYPGWRTFLGRPADFPPIDVSAGCRRPFAYSRH